MSAATKAVAGHGLARRAFSLGAVKALDQALQFLLPILLVRTLDAATFGEYRLLWLVMGTVLAVAPLSMHQALFYFLPRSDGAQRKLYLHQTAAYLAVAGLAAALIVSPLNPWVPDALAPLMKHGALVPAFIAVWVVAAMMDFLPTIEERIRLQAASSISVAVARAALVAVAAFAAGTMEAILWLLLAVALLKLGFLVAYVQRFHGWGRPWFSASLFAGQFRYTAPFGVSSALYVLRTQADQWVAASLFALHSFAAFSIAAIVGQVVNLFRTSVLEAFLPSMSRLEAAGDLKSAMALNARANALVGLLLFPLLGFAFAFAEEIVTLVYTAAYLEAAPVMRLYIVGLVILVLEVASLLQLLRQGMFHLGLNAAVLGLSVPLSWAGAVHFGLTGAAAGSVIAVALDRTLMLRRISRLTGVPLRGLQQWGALFRSLAWSAGAALGAWLVVHHLFAPMPSVLRLSIGAGLIAILYLPALYRRP